MKRAATDEVLALTAQLHTGLLDQPLQGDLLLQPLDLLVWDSRHALSSRTLSRRNSALFLIAYVI